MMPWKLMETAGNYLFVWLVGYSSLLGPIAGILIADYFFIQKRQLALYDLYQRDKMYEYRGGWNPAGIWALLLGVAPNIPGFLYAAGVLDSTPVLFQRIYDNAWFIGAIVASVSYYLFMRKSGPAWSRAGVVPE